MLQTQNCMHEKPPAPRTPLTMSKKRETVQSRMKPGLQSDASALGSTRCDDRTDTSNEDGDRPNANPHT